MASAGIMGSFPCLTAEPVEVLGREDEIRGRARTGVTTPFPGRTPRCFPLPREDRRMAGCGVAGRQDLTMLNIVSQALLLSTWREEE